MGPGIVEIVEITRSIDWMGRISHPEESFGI